VEPSKGKANKVNLQARLLFKTQGGDPAIKRALHQAIRLDECRIIGGSDLGMRPSVAPAAGMEEGFAIGVPCMGGKEAAGGVSMADMDGWVRAKEAPASPLPMRRGEQRSGGFPPSHPIRRHPLPRTDVGEREEFNPTLGKLCSPPGITFAGPLHRGPGSVALSRSPPHPMGPEEALKTITSRGGGGEGGGRGIYHGGGGRAEGPKWAPGGRRHWGFIGGGGAERTDAGGAFLEGPSQPPPQPHRRSGFTGAPLPPPKT